MPIEFICENFDTFFNDKFDFEKTLIIVPGIYQENCLENIFLKKSETGSIPGGKVLRFEDLIFRHLTEHNISPTPISNHIKKEIIRNSLLVAKKRNELVHFGSIFQKEGLINQFTDSITELKKSRVRAEELLMISQNQSSQYQREKLYDISLVLSYYNDFLKSNDLRDKEDYLESYITLIDSKTYLSSFIFNGFNSLTGLEIEIINKLKINHEVKFFYRGYPPYAEVLNLKTKLQKHDLIFNENSKAICAFGLTEEIKEICYFILESVQKKESEFCDFSIVLKNKDQYLPIIKRFFKEFNIPIKCTFNIPLKNYPFVAELINILSATLKNCINKDNLDILETFKKEFSLTGLFEKFTSSLSHDSVNINNLKVYFKFIEVLQETEKTLKTLNLFISSTYFFDIFNSIIKVTSLEGTIDNSNGVTIIDFRYCDSVNTRHIIVPQMIEGVLPSTLKINSVLDGNIIFFLKTVHGYNIQSDEDIFSIEKNLFLNLITKTDSNLLFTYHKSGSQNTPNIESSFLKNLTHRESRNFHESNHIEKLCPEKTMEEKLKTDRALNKFSPTGLNTYAACPYKYFVSKILNINIKEESELDINPMDKGSILHHSLEKLYRSNGYQLLKNDPQKARDILRSSLDYFFNKKIKKPTNYQKILKTHLERKLDSFVDKEHEDINSSKSIPPALFEKRILAKIKPDKDCQFNFEEITDASQASDSEIIFEAIIDRVDIDEDNKCFGIVDYKLKNTLLKGVQDIYNSKDFQLPLYILLFRAQKKYYNFRPQYSYFYKLFNLDKSEGIFIKYDEDSLDFFKESAKKNILCEDEFDKLVSLAQKSIFKLIEKIQNLEFPVSPRDNACEFCNYGEICRIKT